MKTFLQKIKLMVPAVTALVMPASAKALEDTDVGNWKLGLLGGNLTLEDVIARVVTLFLVLAGIIAVGYLISGGVSYLTAGGDAEKAGAGKTTIIHAVIGIIVITAAYLIFNYVMLGLGGGVQPIFE